MGDNSMVIHGVGYRAALSRSAFNNFDYNNKIYTQRFAGNNPDSPPEKKESEDVPNLPIGSQIFLYLSGLATMASIVSGPVGIYRSFTAPPNPPSITRINQSWNKLDSVYQDLHGAKHGDHYYPYTVDKQLENEQLHKDAILSAFEKLRADHPQGNDGN
jgi:hypothetical protein